MFTKKAELSHEEDYFCLGISHILLAVSGKFGKEDETRKRYFVRSAVALINRMGKTMDSVSHPLSILQAFI